MAATKRPAPTLMCDIDGVVYPYTEKLQAEVERLLPKRRIPQAAVYELTAAWGITFEEQVKGHLALFRDADTHDAEPIEGASEALWALHQSGCNITFVTRRAHYTQKVGGDFEHARELTKTWLETWAPPHEAMFVNNKAKIGKPFGLLIDDNPAEARTLRGLGNNVWLCDQPYNRDANDITRFDWRRGSDIGMPIHEMLGITK